MIWLEVIKLIISGLTPIAVAIFGILLLRRIESVKASVAMHSDFRKKWADQFFDCCQNMLITLERQLALLTVCAGSDDPNSEYGTRLQNEIRSLWPTIAELDMRIRRSVVFAPRNGGDVREALGACLRLVQNLLDSKQGNVDEIFCKMNLFNRHARMAHAEIFGVQQ